MNSQRKQDINAAHSDLQEVQQKLIALQMDLENEWAHDLEETQERELHDIGEAIQDALNAVDEAVSALVTVTDL